jgi:hypothetical protein
VNCSIELIHDLQGKGVSTPTTILHLGLELGTDMNTTVGETLCKINLKAVKWWIPATAPPNNILHRAALINSALIPLYNHALMALPITGEDLLPLCKEILPLLFIKTINMETFQKRIVAREPLSADFGMGGL